MALSNASVSGGGRVKSQRRKTAQLCYNAAKAFVLIVVTYRVLQQEFLHLLRGT
jgi:hypothetical protein